MMVSLRLNLYLHQDLLSIHYNIIQKGFLLEDGEIKVDEVHLVKNAQNKELLVTLHSGRNRIVRRIFEFFGYKVVKLDRIEFAGISKKK